jgi:hypothetical protein
MMENPTKEYYTLEEVLGNARSYIALLFRKWYLVTMALVIGGLIGLGLFFLQKPKYEAECTFILEEKQGGFGGGLSGIANQFGLDIGGMSGGGMFAGDNIIEILTSKVILQKVLLSSIDSVKGSTTLADLYLDFTGLKGQWANHTMLGQVNYHNVRNVSQLNVVQDSVLNIAYADVVKKHLFVERISKKGSIMSVRVVGENPVFARLLVQRLVLESRNYYVNVKTSVASANVSRLQRKADSLSRLLNNKTYQVAQVQLNDLNPALREYQVPVEVANRDKTIIGGLYTEVVKNLEIAKTTLMLQTPVIEVLDVPSLSLYDNKKGKIFFCVIGSFICAVLCCGLLFAKFVLRNKVAKKEKIVKSTLVRNEN